MGAFGGHGMRRFHHGESDFTVVLQRLRSMGLHCPGKAGIATDKIRQVTVDVVDAVTGEPRGRRLCRFDKKTARWPIEKVAT